jgi:rubrerythrin
MKNMKNKTSLYIVVALFVGFLAAFILNNSFQKTANQSQTARYSYGNGMGQAQNINPSRENCLADDCLLVDELEYPVGELAAEVQLALDEAINDEYKALATYEAVIAEFGAVRPFSMIKGAEEQHIASLKAIYDKYALTVPENDWASKVVAPATLQEACQTGVEAEIANAALYREELLPVVADHEDIKLVFESLMSASEDKHLPAFEKCN